MGLEPITPTPKADTLPITPCSNLHKFLERIGLEPTILCMQNIRDNQLHYRPQEDQIGFEPMTL